MFQRSAKKRIRLIQENKYYFQWEEFQMFKLLCVLIFNFEKFILAVNYHFNIIFLYHYMYIYGNTDTAILERKRLFLLYEYLYNHNTNWYWSF